MEDNIVSLGFDTNRFTPEQKIVYEGLLQVFTIADKIDNLKISPTLDPSWKTLKDAIKAQGDEIKKLQDANLAYARSQVEVTKLDRERIKNAQEAEKLEQQSIKTRQAKTNETNKNAAASQKEAKQIAELSNEYFQLNKAHQDAILRYRNLYLVKGEDAKATREALEAANSYGAVLTKLDANLGIHNRNVGNYKSAFDGLGMSFTQIARELPSITMGFQQFALAISNNIPMVQDELKKARAEIVAMRAEGKEVPSLVSRIAGSILSWNVALSVGIALLTAFAKPLSEWVTGLFDSSVETEKAAVKTGQLNQAYLDLIKTQKELSEFLKRDTGPQRDLENQIVYAKARNEQQSKILATELELAKLRALNAQKEEGYSKDDTIALAKKITEEQELLNQIMTNYAIDGKLEDEKAQKDIQRRKLSIDLLKERYSQQKAIDLEYHNSFRDLKEKEIQIEEYNAAELRKINLFNAVQKAELTKDANERALRDDAATQAQKLTALKNTAEAEKKILTAQNKDKQNTPGLSDNDKKISAEKTASDIKKIDKDLAENTYKINEEYRKRNLDADRAAAASRLELQTLYNQLTLEDELATLRSKIKAQEDNTKIQVELENARYSAEKDKKGLTTKEIQSLEAQHQEKLTVIATKATVDRLRLITELELNAVKDTNTQSETQSLVNMTREYDRLLLSLEQKKITYAQFQKDKEKIDRKAADNALQDQLVMLEAEKGILEKGKKSTIDIENQIAAVKKAQKDKQLDNAGKTVAKEIDLEKQKKDAYIQLGRESLDFMQTLFTSQYEEEKNRIADLIALSDERYSKEIANIRASSFTEQEKHDKIAILEADQAATRKKYDEEIRQANIKKAKADRVFQIFQIAGNTAIGITSALAQFPPNPILAAIIGAIGAVQIAKVLATPIPRYEKGAGVNGRPLHPGGIAEYGEAGSELIEEPGKAPRVVDSREIGYLSANTKITPLTSDFVNENMQAGAMRLQAAYMSGERNKIDESWAIARYLSKQNEKNMAKLVKRKMSVSVHLTTGASGGFVNSQYGRG